MTANSHMIEQRLRELGVLEKEDPIHKNWRMRRTPTRLLVRQVWADEGNRIIRAEVGTLIVIYLSVISDAPGKIYIVGYDLDLPWPHPLVDWLTDSGGLGHEVKKFWQEERQARPGYAILGGRPKLLKRRDLVEGVLFGHCHNSVPNEIL